MSDTLLKVDANGNETTWYSQEYLNKRIEEAFDAGKYIGVRVEFIAMEPTSSYALNQRVIEFKKHVAQEISKDPILQTFINKKV